MHINSDAHTYQLGTNVYTIALLESDEDLFSTNLDGVAIYDDPTTLRTNDRYERIMLRAVQAGIPVMVVERDGEMHLRDPRQPQPKKAHLSANQLRHALSIYREHELSTNAAQRADLAIDLEEVEEGYEFRQVEFKLPGKKLWLIHRQGPDEIDTSGAEMRRAW